MLERPRSTARLQDHGIASEFVDPDLHRRACPQARVKENQGNRFSGKCFFISFATFYFERRIDQAIERLDGVVRCAQEIHHEAAPEALSFRHSTRISTCSAVVQRGGSKRRNFGSLDVPVMIFCSRSLACTGAHGVSNSIPSKQPLPRIATTPGRLSALSRSVCSTIFALSSIPSFSIASSVATTAAIASMPPPNVVPRSFSLMC